MDTVENKIEDLTLIKKVKSENKRESEEAFSMLYEKYYNSILFNFRNMVNDSELAEDLINVAFSKISKNILMFNEEKGAFSTWLFTLTRNIFIDNMRGKKEQSIHFSDLTKIGADGEVIEFDTASNDKTPEDEILYDERSKEVRKAINSIKNKKIAYFLKLRYFEELSYEEISERTKISLGAVKTYIFRAKSALRDELEKLNFKY